MKELFKIPVLLFLLILSSCSEDEVVLQQENKIESTEGRAMLTSCNIIPVASINNCPGVSEDYTVETEEFTNPTYLWTVESGDITIISSNTNQNITVTYGSNYIGGSLKVVVSDANIICSTIEALAAGINCNGGGGCDITASINEEISACYPSPNGKFSLTYAGNSSNVTWSVDNNNGTILSQSGKNEVIVKANNFSSFTLTATVTEGNCTETFSQVITPCNNCNASISATIVEDIRPCYPSNHPHGRYWLSYNGNSSNVTWSVDYGIILAQSGKYEVQVKPTTGLPFTLTATVVEGLCVKNFNMVIYPIIDPSECEGTGGGGLGGPGNF